MREDFSVRLKKGEGISHASVMVSRWNQDRKGGGVWQACSPQVTERLGSKKKQSWG